MNGELSFGRVKGSPDFFLSGTGNAYDQAAGISGETKHILRIPVNNLSWLAIQSLMALSDEERQFVLMGLEEAI